MTNSCPWLGPTPRHSVGNTRPKRAKQASASSVGKKGALIVRRCSPTIGALRTVGLDDSMWIHVRDIPGVFGARRYGTDDSLVMEVDGARWALGNDGCRKLRSRADVTVDRESLGALVLGGINPSMLARAHRLTARNDASMRRADAMFRSYPDPYSQTNL